MYPERLPQRRWFAHCATLFDTVEINNTFCRLPPPETTEGWAAQAPPGFSSALELGQFGSSHVVMASRSPGANAPSTWMRWSAPGKMRTVGPSAKAATLSVLGTRRSGEPYNANNGHGNARACGTGSKSSSA